MRVILTVLFVAASAAASDPSPRDPTTISRRSFESTPFGSDRRFNPLSLPSNADGPTSTQYFGHGAPPLTIRHPRPPAHNRRQRPQSIPPYAVQMEPLVQYSQPDPLFDQRRSKPAEKTVNDHVKKTTASSANSLPVEHGHKSHFADGVSAERKLTDSVHDALPSGSNQLTRSPIYLSPDQPLYQDGSESHHQHIYLNHNHHDGPRQHHYDHGQYYSREPEPIIEIIIQESNVTLPPPPAQPAHPISHRKKEPVQVFYVKYKKNPNGYGKDDVIYEKPVAAVTPASNNVDDDADHGHQHAEHHVEHTTVPPTPHTTLRTIIRPDSETFHGGPGIHVTFGEHHGDIGDPAHGESVQQSAPQPAVVLPQRGIAVAQQRQGLDQFAGFPNHAQKRNPEPFQQEQHANQQLGNQPFQAQNGPAGSFPRSNNQQGTPQQSSNNHQFQPPHPGFGQQLPFNNQPALFRQPPQQQPPQHFPSAPPAEFGQPPPPPRHSAFQQPPQFNQRPPHQFLPQPPQPFQQAGPPQHVAHQRPSFQNAPPQEHQQRPPQFPAQPTYHTIPANVDNFLRNNPQQQNQQHQHQHNQHQQNQHQQNHQQQNHQQKNHQQPAQQHNNQQRPAQINNQHQQPSINSQQQLNSQQQHQQKQQHQQNQQQLQHQRQQQQQNQQPDKHQHLEILGGPKFNGEIIKSVQPVLELHQTFQQPPSRNVTPQQNQPQPQRQQFQQAQPQGQQFQQAQPQVQQNNQQFFKQNQQPQQSLQQQHFQQPPQQQQQQQQQHQFNQNQGQRSQVQQQIELINQQLQQNPLHNHQPLVPAQTFTTQTARPSFPQTQPPRISSQPLFHPQPASPFKVQSSLPKQLPVHQLTANNVAPRFAFSPQKAEPVTTTKPIVVQDVQPEVDEEREKAAQKTKDAKIAASLAAFPDEVPEEIRQQLIDAGILGNADIQILDYDKVGDIPIDQLPPHALEHFKSAGGQAAAGSAPIPSVLRADAPRTTTLATPVEMKVVRYDPKTAEGKEIADRYVREDATHVDPVVLNDSRYNRYLPLKVVGTQFPLPDVPELRGRNVTSVVVLAPVDYDFLQKAKDEGASAVDLDRLGRAAPVEVQGVRFVAGEILKELVKNPTRDNYRRWLQQEQATPADRQSIVLLVAGPTADEDPNTKEIFMYDVSTQKVSKLRGELSSAFVDVAEANAGSQDLDNISIPPAAQQSDEQNEYASAASEVVEQRVAYPEYQHGFVGTPTGVDDLAMAASELQEVEAPVNRVLISSSYSKSTKTSHAKK